MEKYAVEIKQDQDNEKTATWKRIVVGNCSKCGTMLEATSNVPKCPNCGTNPWEITKDKGEWKNEERK